MYILTEGGALAAPVVRNVLEESLKYLGIEPQYTEDELKTMDVPAPELGRNEQGGCRKAS